MIHSFSVEVAEEYGIEKAVILHNFYFWVKENKINGRNIYKGKAYTYNTSDALAELFPYLKARKIAELLRCMEYDGLIESIQNKGTNRVKSYTLTEKAWEYYTTIAESKKSNIQNNDVPTYENTTMEHTENQQCSIADNKHTDINIHIEKNKKTKKEFIPPTIDEVRQYCREKNYNIDAEQFISYYESNNWKDKNNAPVKNWKLKLVVWSKNSNTSYSKKGSMINQLGTDEVTDEDLKNINF